MSREPSTWRRTSPRTCPISRWRLRLGAAQRYGLKPGDVRRQSSTLLASEEVSDVFQGGKAYDVHVWSIPSARNSLTDVERLPIDTPDGGRVRLEQIAEIDVAPTPNHIERELQSRRIDVGANVEGRDLGSVVSEVEERLADVQFPREYHAEVLGESTELNAAQDRLTLFGIGAGDRDLPPASGRLRQPSPGGPDLRAAADGAGGRSAGGVAGRRRAVARLAGRVPDRVRDRGPQRDPDDQPLPASRAPRGRAVRPRARAARERRSGWRRS